MAVAMATVLNQNLIFVMESKELIMPKLDLLDLQPFGKSMGGGGGPNDPPPPFWLICYSK